jgi:sulfite reductase (NADPH) flavoprotein alpha-component
LDPFEAPGPGLTQQQWEQIKALAAALSPKQALWISGYFAGVEHALEPAPISAGSAPAPASLSPGLGPGAEARRLTILYGSETGNSAALARAAGAQAQALGLLPVVADMADYKMQRLKDEQDLLIVTSTYGEGDPPQPATGFFEFVESRKAPPLPGLRYAVLALGDSTYARYCEAGKRLDKRFEELGAARFYPRVDCDVDYELPAAAWTHGVLARLTQERGDGTAQAVVTAPAITEPKSCGFDKHNPFLATIIDNIVLTGRGSTKETRHIELSLVGSGLSFEPGDALGVLPRNDPVLVETILGSLGLAASTPVTVKDGKVPLSEALQAIFEITTATPRFLEHWAELTGAGQLKRLLSGDYVQERAAYLRDHHIIDLIRRFPAPGLAAEAFVAGLRLLQPRLYSIASSPVAMPDEVHLTISTVRYRLHGETRAGVASGYFADRGATETRVPVFVQANRHFRLPADGVPILMIGAGTGVAPYRGFLQEREARGATGFAWLFFGERNFRTDFLYQVEWQAYLKSKVLTRMDAAFSRDGAQKAYVQHRMLERAGEIFAWLEDGAHVYVCGDASRLAPDVHAALIAIIAEQGGMAREAAEDYLDGLQRGHRYQRDVY